MYHKIVRYKLIFYTFLLGLVMIDCSKKDSITEPPDYGNSAVIDLNNTLQIIRGFGGVNMPGWIPDLTTDQVYKAFGTEAGQIGMSILRIRVPYDKDAFYLEVPTAKLTKSLGAIIFASPWTPPPSMKSNNNIVGGTLNDSSYAAYAAHLKSFADYMASNGAPLDVISVQNEPDVTVTYESCSWNAAQMLKFVKNNVSPIGLKIIIPESYNFNHTISDAILNDDVAASNISIIGGHIYGGGISSYPLAVSKGKEVWMTEHLLLDTTWWGGGFNTAREINDCMSVGMNAYIWWYIRRFYGSIDDNGNLTKRGYAISQYARFIRPGYVRVGTIIDPATYVDVTAYKNGSKVIIVVINGNYSPVDQTFTLLNGIVKSFTPYVTSETRNCSKENDIIVVDNNFTFKLEEQSVITFVSN